MFPGNNIIHRPQCLSKKSKVVKIVIGKDLIKWNLLQMAGWVPSTLDFRFQISDFCTYSRLFYS